MRGNAKKGPLEEKVSGDKSEKKLPLKPANPLRHETKPKTQLTGALNPIKQLSNTSKPFSSGLANNRDRNGGRNEEGPKASAPGKGEGPRRGLLPLKQGNLPKLPGLKGQREPVLGPVKPVRPGVRALTMGEKPGLMQQARKGGSRERRETKGGREIAGGEGKEESEGEGESEGSGEESGKVEPRAKLDKKTMARNVSSYEEWKRKNQVEASCKVRPVVDRPRCTS
jgi:hypothetical protein